MASGEYTYRSGVPEKRAHPRVKCQIPSRVRCLAGQLTETSETTLEDISEGGVRFRSNRFIPLSEKVLLSMSMPKSEPVEAIGRPVWIRELPHLGQFEFGVQYVEIAGNGRRYLREFVGEHLKYTFLLSA